MLYMYIQYKCQSNIIRIKKVVDIYVWLLSELETLVNGF